MGASRFKPATTALQHASDIPDKLYFKIGEVAQLVGVKAYVLRYWEKKIPALIRPSKSASQQRRYRRGDIDLFREVRRLVSQEKYTLEGACQLLLSRHPTASSSRREPPPDPTPPPAPHPSPCLCQERLNRLKQGLRALIMLAGEKP